MDLWERIAKANSEMEYFTMERNEKDKETGKWNVKKTQYAEVKERVIAFRKVYPEGCIITEPTFTENYIMVKANIYSNSSYVENEHIQHLLATGYARELGNKSFALENAETSAIGRALGFCGFGIKTGIASKEDIENYNDTKIFDEAQMELDKKRKAEAIEKFTKLSGESKATILNLMHVKKVEDIETDMLEQLVRNAK